MYTEDVRFEWCNYKKFKFKFRDAVSRYPGYPPVEIYFGVTTWHYIIIIIVIVDIAKATVDVSIRPPDVCLFGGCFGRNGR